MVIGKYSDQDSATVWWNHLLTYSLLIHLGSSEDAIFVVLVIILACYTWYLCCNQAFYWLTALEFWAAQDQKGASISYHDNYQLKNIRQLYWALNVLLRNVILNLGPYDIFWNAMFRLSNRNTYVLWPWLLFSVNCIEDQNTKTWVL